MLSFVVTGSFARLGSFLNSVSKVDITSILERYGQEGVNALANVTPTDTGLAASSWSYRITKKHGVYEIAWLNSDVENGFPVVVMRQYGHGTANGGYVTGIDFINPAIRPIFEQIASDVWKAVTSA